MSDLADDLRQAEKMARTAASIMLVVSHRPRASMAESDMAMAVEMSRELAAIADKIQCRLEEYSIK